jgi:alpha-1,2-glucosyltransferase
MLRPAGVVRAESARAIARNAKRDLALSLWILHPEEEHATSLLIHILIPIMARLRAPEPSRSVLAVPPESVLLYGLAALCLHFWLSQVCATVPEPYLDEVFHIPQAQAYWAGSWKTWNPKITTPPGLYIYSYLFAKFLNVFGECGLSVRQLRTSIELLLMAMPAALLRCHPLYHKYDRWSPALFAQIVHANLNIILYPLLFFFSALYYTDILSAFAVTEVYRWYVYKNNTLAQRSSVSSKLSGQALSSICGMAIFLLGLFAMSVRQTNVFWVAVFLGGLQTVRTLSSRKRPAPSITKKEVSGMATNAYIIYDPPVHGAGIEST